MTEATLTWSIWQALLNAFACSFTRRGFRRFAEWITAMALNVEEHTITQSVLALEQPAAWKALESFAEYGGWHRPRHLGPDSPDRDAPGRIWHGYQVSAVDDTKVHRTSPHVWGTCTFHEYTARCPNRATTVRAHNWVVLGALLHEPEKPGWFLPISGRLYFRQSQLPAGPDGHRWRSGPSASWPSSCSASRPGSSPGTSTWASSTAATPWRASSGRWSCPRAARPGRVPHPVAARRPAVRPAPAAGAAPRGSGGRKPKWGRRLPPPRRGGYWKAGWQDGTAFVYGRQRTVRWKEVVCLWRVLGWEVPVKAIVAEVEGYKKRFTLVTSAVELTGLQMVELFAARFRQEDGFRDLKQRLGWEECRAWTANPIERTSQAQWVTMSLLRLLQFRLEAAGEVDWWFRPPWNKDKDRPSVLDAERLMRRHRGGNPAPSLGVGWEMREKPREAVA